VDGLALDTTIRAASGGGDAFGFQDNIRPIQHDPADTHW
jgi:hypothetical protein